MTTVADLVAIEPERWRAATTHPFLDGAADGTLPAAAFDRWLEQDRRFVADLARAWAVVLVDAPAALLPLLADGIGAFGAEVAWLGEVGAGRGLDPEPAPRPATSAYGHHLRAVAAMPVPVALAALWAVEAAYLAAWRTARPGAPAYRAFVEHWTDDGFAAFVARLEAAADEALAGARPDVVAAAARAVAATAGHEAAFWAMTWGADGAAP